MSNIAFSLLSRESMLKLLGNNLQLICTSSSLVKLEVFRRNLDVLVFRDRYSKGAVIGFQNISVLVNVDTEYQQFS